MNIKKIILNNGFTYRELLTMKNNFHAMRKWYRLERKSIPESEPKDFIKYILLIAIRSCFTPFVSFIIGCLLTMGIILMYGDIRSTLLMFSISLFSTLYAIHIAAKSESLNIVTTVKLIKLHTIIKLKNLKQHLHHN